MPAVRRVFGESHEFPFRMRWNYAVALYRDPAAPLDDFREAVTTLEDLERTARRVFGGAHPLVAGIERNLRKAQAALRAREAAEDWSLNYKHKINTTLSSSPRGPRTPRAATRSRRRGSARPQ